MINKYENRRTLICLLIVIVTISSFGYIFSIVRSDILSTILGFAVSIFGCFLINFLFKYYDKKIKKYEKDNAEQLSLDSSSL